MFEQVLFFETVRAAAAPLGAVEGVDTGDDLDHMAVRVTDFLPGPGREPWVVDIRRVHDHVHPLFGDRYPCVEVMLPFLTIAPHTPGYLEQVASHAASSLDYQRYCAGAAVTWDPDTGHVGIHGHVRLRDQPPTTLTAELGERLRAVVALAYLLSFRIWQVALRRQVSEAESTPLITHTHARMLELLGATPPP